MTHRDLPYFANLRDGGNLPRQSSASSDMRKAIYVALALLCVAIFVANKALPQAAYDAVNHEVIR